MDLYKKVEKIVNGKGGLEEKLLDISKLLRDQVPHYDWVGFYLADNSKEELYLSSYAGDPTEHVRIPYGQGICGQVAEEQKTFVIQDVNEEDNYLSCSPSVQSEIVVPIFKGDVFVGELDIDSHELNPFSEADREMLEKICAQISRLF